MQIFIGPKLSKRSLNWSVVNCLSETASSLQVKQSIGTNMWFAFRMQQKVPRVHISFYVYGSCTACLSFLNGSPITRKSVALKQETQIYPTWNPISAETWCTLLRGHVTTAPSLYLLSSVLPPHRFYCRSTHLEGHFGPLSNPHRHANGFPRSMGHRTYLNCTPL